ncbi:YncE family protein [Riemerella anatipestifer]|uniref:YncE family protein n=1 Tax=Riemerella anatipestifer TaxID=34085 RepID=UPI0021F86337|nr:hypothetical protein [Riemerella anatipestifer]MCW0508051.1 hypothetical protein [Riemerella anatipestifer]MRM96726.1 hypothetical protein [Riemerella anatipestifer]MRN01515.1 hypothetical protein [Riemerella anatipestifer]MRN03599.1 hypothetical protein [Riemerella anatipestifer]
MKRMLFLYIQFLLFICCNFALISCKRDVNIIDKYIDELEKVTKTEIKEFFVEAEESDVISNENFSELGSNFQPLGMQVFGDTLYVSDRSSHNTYLFNAKSYKYLTTIKGSNGEPAWNSRDVYVSDSLLFIPAADNTSQISVFNKKTLKPLIKLGNGNWWQDITHPNAIAADENYVYVRHMQSNIRVFSRQSIEEGIAKGIPHVRPSFNIPFSPEAFRNTDQDMCILEDKLYFMNNSKESPGINVFIRNNNSNSYENKYITFEGKKVIPHAITYSDKYVVISVSGDFNGIIGYDKSSFSASLNLNTPLFEIQFPDFVGKNLKAEPNIKFLAMHGETLFIQQNQRIIPLKLRGRLYNVISK